jgi:hypothetical protein
MEAAVHFGQGEDSSRGRRRRSNRISLDREATRKDKNCG